MDGLRNGLERRSDMVSPEYDEIIVGQGLAGTALAWSLRKRNHRILVVDRQAAVTSSRIAAGLMTPITGQRLVKSWRWNPFWAAAEQFYTRIEFETGESFFHPTRMIRLLANPREREFLERRWTTEFEGLVDCPVPLANSEWFDLSRGGFEMTQGGRLEVRTYLDVSRRQFERDGQYKHINLAPDADLELTDHGVRIPRLGLTSRRVVFCQGFDAIRNPWFTAIRFNPAKGEILTLRIRGLAEQRIVHGGVWLMPLGEDLFRAGATYDWNQLNDEPTLEGRNEICVRLSGFLRLPFEVVGHDAAVRPILHRLNPLIGLHPVHPQLGFFNGLGSKGSLQSPYLAEQFAGFLAGEISLDPELDLRTTMSSS